MTDIQFTFNSSKASIWQQHFIQWQSSGLTQKAYCQEHNLSHRQFLYWRARQKQGHQGLATPVCSVPVSVLETVSELTVAPVSLRSYASIQIERQRVKLRSNF